MEAAGTAVGIASLGIQVCQGLLSYYEAWKGYDSDISSTYNAITDLSKTLTLLKATLEQNMSDERAGRISTCVRDCEDALLELEKKRASLQKYARPEGLRQKMRSGVQRSWYPFRKETLETLKVSVTEVQGRLMLALQVLQLDIGTESQRLVDRILNQTATQSDSIAHIAAQNQRLLDAQRSDEFRKIIAWLAPPDPGTNHATARQHHQSQTGDWLLKSTQYQSWKTGSVSHLWMNGKAGCGKTILCFTAIEDIHIACDQDPDTSHAFFYFTFSEKRKQSDGDLLRSLVAQLGWREPGLSMLRQAYRNSSQSVPGPDELEKILLETIRSCSRVYLLVDALDECPEEHEARQRVLDRIERLTHDAPNLKVFATSRELPTIRESLEALGSEPLRIPTSSVDADIRKYLASQLSSDRSFLRFSPVTLNWIKSTISTKADGMFRWAYCQLQVLRKLKSTSPKYVKKALDGLPATLDETYKRVLLDIEEMYRDHALTLLQWLAYAHSPPTLGELVEAAVTDPIHESSIDTDNRGDLEDTLNILTGLVTVVESKETDVDSDSDSDSEIEPSTPGASSIILEQADVASHSPDLTPDTRVRLAHFSVKEYLESKRILESDARHFHLESGTGHRTLAQSCLTYLRYYSESTEKTSTDEDLDKFPLLKYGAESWFYHSALQQSVQVDREVLFLQLEEARRDWLLIYDPDAYPSGSFNVPDRMESGSAVYYASVLGLLAVVSDLLGSGANVNAQGGTYGNALQAASARGYTEVVQLLIDNGADVNARGGSYSNNALEAASVEGYTEVVQLLIDKGADVNAQDGYYGNALQAASVGGYTEVVQLLIDKGADVNAQGGEYGNALQAASVGGYTEVVQLLIDEGADVNARGGYYGTVLQAALANGYAGIVQLLIDKGANVNAQGGLFGNTPEATLAWGRTEMAQRLRSFRAREESTAVESETGKATEAM
ncbi:hypothetical protein MBLNU230_g5562t1 [Neophaeotheca triangularis]